MGGVRGRLITAASLLLTSAVALPALGTAVAQRDGPFELTRATVAGGGYTFSTGGYFTVGGTIGQPDAGLMMGGDFTLSGGFWVGAEEPAAPFSAQATKTVTPEGPVAYGDPLTYTLVISAPVGTEMELYDPLIATTFERFAAQPEGVLHAHGAITGTVLVTPTGQITVSFLVEVDATQGLLGSATNKACIRPTGGLLADCLWSNDVANLLTREEAPGSCLPRYGDRHTILQVNETAETYEAFPTVGDFNGDGLSDILITRLQFQTDAIFALDILLNDGNGGMTLATSEIFSGSAPLVQHPTDVIVADLNGDGRSDIFVANTGNDSPPHPGFLNALALTSLDGRLVDATPNLPGQNDVSHSACAADIDGDQDIDLYVGNFYGQNDIDPQILLNDGSGRFAVGQGLLPPTVMLSHNGYTTCSFADVNNDGSPDLILGHTASIGDSPPVSEVLLNDGVGGFAVLPGAMPPKTYDPTDKAQDIAPVDLDGDGYLDLLAVYERQSDASNYIRALINNQDGTFRDESASRLASFYDHFWPNWPATSGNPRRTLELWDMDRDGHLDIMAKTYDADHPKPLLLLNDGNGTFTWQPFEFSMGRGDLYYVFIDLEGDGGHDILLTLNVPPDYVEAIRDLGCPAFLPLVVSNYPLEPCLPEFGEDQILLTIDTDGGIERLRTWDVDGDGWPDVMVTRATWPTSKTHEIGVLLNDQQGGLVDGTQIAFEGPVPKTQHPTRIILRDFDGDGRTDAFIADHGMDGDPYPGYQNILVLSLPGGRLMDATANLPQQNDGPHSAAAADVDGDDDVDLYVGNTGANNVPPQVWLNDGTGRFSVAAGLLPPEQTNLLLNNYTASELADVNKDAFPDLILGQSNPSRDSHVLLNDGSGHFTQMETPLPPTVFAPIQQPMDIKAADINGDGYLDLFLADTRYTYIGRYIQVLINNGDGTFRDETAARLFQATDGGWLRYLDLLDLNYDGYVDIVGVAMEGPTVFYLNNGQGVFSEWDHGTHLSSVFLDLDRDGWRDNLLSGSTEPGTGLPEWHAIKRHIGCLSH
jgi:hypothetical protein